MTLLDWIDMWSLPGEPIDSDVAHSVMERKFRQLCQDKDWQTYAFNKWPDEMFELAPDLMEQPQMMQQIEHFQDQGVTGDDIARYPVDRQEPVQPEQQTVQTERLF